MIIPKLKQYLKIFAVLVLAFFIASAFNSEVFIRNTPVLRSNIIGNIALKINSTRSSFTRSLALLLKPQVRQANQLAKEQGKKAIEALATLPFKQVSKGTYAKTNGTATITLVKLGEIEVMEYTFVINGETVKIHVPKDANITEAQLREQYGAK